MGKVVKGLRAEQQLAMELRETSLLLLSHHTSKRRRIGKGRADCRASVWFCEQSCCCLVSLPGAFANDSLLF